VYSLEVLEEAVDQAVDVDMVFDCNHSQIKDAIYTVSIKLVPSNMIAYFSIFRRNHFMTYPWEICVEHEYFL